MGVVTHCEIPLTSNEQLTRGDGINWAWSAGQCHGLEDFRAVAHNRDAGYLQAKTPAFLWGAKQAGVLAAVALRVLFHLALGATEDADLEGLLVGDEAAIVATATHDCRRSSSRHRGRKRRGPGTVVVLGLAGRDVSAVDGRVGITAVGVKIARDLSVNDACCQ